MKKLLLLVALLMLTKTLSAAWVVDGLGPGILFTLTAGTTATWPITSLDNDSAPEILWWEQVGNPNEYPIADVSIYTSGWGNNRFYYLKVTTKSDIGCLWGGASGRILYER